MKQKKSRLISFVTLLFITMLAACDWEKRADTEVIEAARTINVTSPLDNVEVDFQPVDIKACCWANGNPATLMIDGNTSGYWDWGWNSAAITTVPIISYPQRR
jgi:hypothetical protein